jgi:hypothetical protein
MTSGNSDAFQAIQDPNNNFAIEMHQYLDSDGSGTNATCVSPAVGAQRLGAATAWLQANNYKGFLGEIGAGNNGQSCATPATMTRSDVGPRRLHGGRLRRLLQHAAVERLARLHLVGCWPLVGVRRARRIRCPVN